uniref:Uncharacterized protein n=1 Tax=Anguilla anguilla TaxID=7936 RepID=A0A0E9PTX1_ANGAN
MHKKGNTAQYVRLHEAITETYLHCDRNCWEPITATIPDSP